jgi:hypothetical protein
MPGFEFNPDKSFEENVAAFKAYISSLDPHCAEILFEHLNVLVGDADPSKSRVRREQFNSEVAHALDALIADEGS